MFKLERHWLKTNSLILTLTSSLFLTGCSTSNLSKDSIITKGEENGIYLEQPTEDGFYYISGIDTSLNNIYGILPSDYIDYSVRCTPSNFERYVSGYSCTYFEVKESLMSTDLPDNIKTIILEGLNNLENINFGINLSVLNYNLKHLKIKYLDGMSSGVVACFDSFNHELQINRNINDQIDFLYKKIIIHEILGHGMTIAYSEENGGVLCDLAIPSVTLNSGNPSYIKVGYSMNEAIAEIITYYASGIKVSCNDSIYGMSTVQLLMFLKSNNIRISEFANKGIPYLIEEMSKNGVELPTSFISSCDVKLLATSNNADYSSTIPAQSTYYAYLTMIVDNKKNKGESVDDISIFLNNCIDSYNGIVAPIDMDNDKIIMVSNAVGSDYLALENIRESILTYNKGITK